MKEGYQKSKNVLDVWYQYFGDTGLMEKHKTAVVRHYLMGEPPEFSKEISKIGKDRLKVSICFENASMVPLEVMIRDQLPEECKGDISNIRLDGTDFSKEELRKGIYCGVSAPGSHFELVYEIESSKGADVRNLDSRAVGFVKPCKESTEKQEWIPIHICT